MKLFIFGSTGDLVKRKVLPALQNLQKEDLEIWAIGRRKFTDGIYKDFVCSNMCSLYFKKRLHYLRINFKKTNLCKFCENLFDKNKINYFYISMPPKYIDKILISLAKLKRKGFKLKILIEKPFGENLKHAKKVEKIIKQKNLKKDVFLSDHYLFKKNIFNLRKNNFKKLELIFTEKLGLEGRTTYYDHIGALKDMVQSHFLNIVFKLLKNPKELKAIKVIKYIRAQYGDGSNQGYIKELGKKSQTETFIYLNLKLNQKEFIFITGKGLNKKQSKIKIDKRVFSIKSETSYPLLFSKFFLEKKEFFPTINDSILSWKIIEKINLKKPTLKYYKKGSSLNKILNNLNRRKEDEKRIQ